MKRALWAAAIAALLSSPAGAEYPNVTIEAENAHHTCLREYVRPRLGDVDPAGLIVEMALLRCDPEQRYYPVKSWFWWSDFDRYAHGILEHRRKLSEAATEKCGHDLDCYRRTLYGEH